MFQVCSCIKCNKRETFACFQWKHCVNYITLLSIINKFTYNLKTYSKKKL